jgi:uncharacterized protein
MLTQNSNREVIKLHEVLIDLILCFTFYSWLGWITETVFKSIRDNRFVNSGFLSGPFCPLYGLGAVIIIQSVEMLDRSFVILNPLTDLIVKVLVAIVLTSLLEYVTGMILEGLFNCKWWDYSDEFFNIQGRVCLKYSVFWGAMAYSLIELIHPVYLEVMNYIPLISGYVFAGLITIYFVVDAIKSVNDVLDLRQLMTARYEYSIEQSLVRHKRILLAFPRLCLDNLNVINQELSSFLKGGIGKIKYDMEEHQLCIDDLVLHDYVQKMKEFRAHYDVSCYEHSVSVSRYSYLICKFLDLDYKSAARGGLLHDLYLYDWRTTTLTDGRHGFVHPRIALDNATSVFELNEIEKDIVLKHMFPLTWQPPSYKEALIVCLVDKYCATKEILVYLFSRVRNRNLVVEMAFYAAKRRTNQK